MLFLIVLYYNVGPFTTWSMYSAEISTLCVILHKHLLNCFLKYIKKSKETKAEIRKLLFKDGADHHDQWKEEL